MSAPDPEKEANQDPHRALRMWLAMRAQFREDTELMRQAWLQIPAETRGVMQMEIIDANEPPMGADAAKLAERVSPVVDGGLGLPVEPRSRSGTGPGDRANVAGTGHEGTVGRRHGPDFRSVSWDGHTYTFSPTQAACVKVLWTAYDNGTPEVGETTILEEAGSDGSKLRDVFKSGKTFHPAWRKMIVQGRKGAFRLSG